MFQFHNGTIKTIWDLIVCGDPPLFQFHNGTIKTMVLASVVVLV